jgi:hypothetical protein
MLLHRSQAQDRPDIPEPMTAILRLPPNAAFETPISIPCPLPINPFKPHANTTDRISQRIDPRE